MTPERLAEIRAKLAKHPDPRPGYPVHDAQRLLAYVDQLEAQLSGECSTAMDIQHANEEHIAQLEALLVEAYLRGHSNGLEQSAQVFEMEAEQGLEDMTFAEFCDWTAGRIRALKSTPGTKVPTWCAHLERSYQGRSCMRCGLAFDVPESESAPDPAQQRFDRMDADRVFTPPDPAVALVRELLAAAEDDNYGCWCSRRPGGDVCDHHRPINAARAWLKGRE